MNVAVILQQVPDTEAVVKPDPARQGAILEDGVKFILNPYDEYAVEEALRITEKDGGEVVGVCIGPERSETAIHGHGRGGWRPSDLRRSAVAADIEPGRDTGKLKRDHRRLILGRK